MSTEHDQRRWLNLVGADVTSCADWQAAQQLQQRQGLAPALGSRLRPVFEDQNGMRLTLESGPTGVRIVPFEESTANQELADATSGFIPMDNQPGNSHQRHNRILRQIAETLGFSPPGANGPPATLINGGFKNMMEDYFNSLPRSLIKNALANSLTSLLLGEGPGNPLAGSLPMAGGLIGIIGGPTGQSVMAALGEALGGPAAQLPSTGAIASNLMSGIGSELLSRWKVADSDSMEEQLANHFTKKYWNQLSNPEATLNKLKSYFVGHVSGATLGAIRVSDVDSAGNAVLQGSANVCAEGLPIGRFGDPVEKNGTAIASGAASVLTNGQLTARVSATSSAGPLPKGATTVFIGGPGGPALPLNSPNSITLADGKIFDPSTGQVVDPKTGKTWQMPPGIQYDPQTGTLFEYDWKAWADDEISGATCLNAEEYRRDWSFETGWSSTPAELKKIPDLDNYGLGWMRDIFVADSNGTSLLGIPEKKGNWYLLGGLIDLGSPQWPGAGTGNWTWVIPDRIGPWDMSDYFVFHDLNFNPGEQDLLEKLGVEAASFGAGLKPDPMQILLQILYSGATTTVALTTGKDDPRIADHLDQRNVPAHLR